VADINKLKGLFEVYGIGVRAGAITPCLEDEKYFRQQLGIPAAPEAVVADWNDSDGVRRPITLQRPGATEELPEGAKDELGNVIGEAGETEADQENEQEIDTDAE
jgi:hypothetical protein